MAVLVASAGKVIQGFVDRVVDAENVAKRGISREIVARRPRFRI